MSYNIHSGKRKKFFISNKLFPQTIDVILLRCEALGIEPIVADYDEFNWDKGTEYAGMIV